MKTFIKFVIFFICLTSTIFAQEIKVNYYWKKPRCITCKKIELYTQKAVQSLNDKSIKFESINVSKRNKNDLQKYKIYTKTVIISKTVNGKEKWKNLVEIWNYIDSEKKFKDYIISEINAFKNR